MIIKSDIRTQEGNKARNASFCSPKHGGLALSSKPDRGSNLSIFIDYMAMSY